MIADPSQVPAEPTERMLKHMAVRIPRRGLVRRAGMVMAWLVGAEWLVQAPKPWDPFAATADDRAQDRSRSAAGRLAALPLDTVPGKPWQKVADGGPAPNGAVGTGDGAVRQDQQGMHGCDCTCMYGANACPSKDYAFGGEVWCYCVQMLDEDGDPQTRFLAFADCFSDTEDHEFAVNCKNSNGRTCWVTGSKTDAMANEFWPKDEHNKPPQGKKYDCTRVIDVTGTSVAQYNADGKWFATLTLPKDDPGTPITEHNVLRTIEKHPGARDLVLPETPAEGSTPSPSGGTAAPPPTGGSTPTPTPPPSTSPTAPTFLVQRTSAARGDQVRVTLSGYVPGETVVLAFDAGPVGAVLIGSDGNGSGSFTVPLTAQDGIHQVTASSQAEGAVRVALSVSGGAATTGTATSTAQPTATPTPPPTRVPLGLSLMPAVAGVAQPVSFVAQGFTSGQNGQLRLDGNAVGTASVGPDGRAQGSFTVPPDTARGPHSVSFSTPADGTATAILQVSG